MPDKTMDSLREAFMKDKDNIPDNCHMADQVSAYAFGELSSEEGQKAKEHLKSCRFCLDLYMDIKQSEEDAEKTKDEKVEVLPGLQKAFDKGKKPPVSPWQKINDAISDFFGGGFGFKPVATFATVALIMFVGFYVMRDSTAPYTIEIMLHGRTQVGFRGGQPEYKDFQVEPGGKINSGDYFRFQTKIDDDAFIYVIFQDSSGNIQSLEKGYIDGGKNLFLPEDNKWYHLDENTGTEKLYMLASTKKIDGFSDKIEKLKSDGIDAIDKVFPEATVKAFSFQHQ